MTALRLGLFLSAQFEPGAETASEVARLAEQAELAEAAGFDSIFVGHHYLTHSAFLQPLALLGYLAARTRRVALGTGVYLLPLANPLALAEEVATIDALSGGRLVLGVGSGYREKEYAALGAPFADRYRRLETFTPLLRRLLAGEEITAEGDWGRLDRARLHLRGRAAGVPDIWMGAFGDIGLKRAARLGCSWLAPPDGDLTELEERFARYRGFLAAAGQSGERAYPLMRECVVAEDRESALAIGRTHLARQYAQYKSWQAAQRSSVDDLLDRFGLVGDPAAVADKMLRLRDRLGLTDLILRVQWSGMPHEDALRIIRLIGDEVIPRMR
jgi:alkanesulfonate monooxygenase SsuD/methylene tetrahydromethanopterin reductase-like flavin-dependent oxidoreductase (luciferase family)